VTHASFQVITTGGCFFKKFFIDNIYPMVDAAPKALWLSTITDTYNIYSRCDEVQVQIMYQRGRATGYIMYQHVYVDIRQLTSAGPALQTDPTEAKPP
jgi:hypothetical protein